ncbi:hypothetical protein ABG067_006603 [Albugo candida]
MFPKALRKAAGSKIPILTTVQLRRASERNAQNLLIENITEKQSNIPKPASKAINNGAQHKVSLKKYNESEKKKTVSVFERLYQQAKKVAPVEAITKRDTTKDLQKSDVPNRRPRKHTSNVPVWERLHALVPERQKKNTPSPIVSSAMRKLKNPPSRRVPVNGERAQKKVALNETNSVVSQPEASVESVSNAPLNTESADSNKANKVNAKLKKGKKVVIVQTGALAEIVSNAPLNNETADPSKAKKVEEKPQNGPIGGIDLETAPEIVLNASLNIPSGSAEMADHAVLDECVLSSLEMKMHPTEEKSKSNPGDPTRFSIRALHELTKIELAEELKKNSASLTVIIYHACITYQIIL